MFDGKLTNIKNTKEGEHSSRSIVTAKITSNDKNFNYIIAEEFVDFVHDLFCIFGVRVSVQEWTISTDSDYLNGEVDVAPPAFVITGSEVNKQVQKIKDNFLDSEMSVFFYNLREAHGRSGSVHRFRSLFSIFDRLSEKTPKKSINYHKMKAVYSSEIQKLYTGHEYFVRFINCVDKLENAQLEDDYGNDYADKLKEAKEKLTSPYFINDQVAEYILRCIQVLRNRLNHGWFKGVTEGVVNAGYELLLPYVQKLINEKSTF
ncbi:hypothetical protein [Clostridium estertheticum]|uniref:hypothetical protein n=1 Tax=Clostridium estertheticum TaxID=238834 RepID=UPI001C0A9C02|nr:hypothetical protein [Clostridium estertheticum]MBU3073856.1 hypothetical protein [Clostridium estertheticum]MBU3163951.1 hypothetical protein [Clostridium estertheticum]